MSGLEYVRNLPVGLKLHYEKHFAAHGDPQALAARRLVSHAAMQDVYPSLVKLLGDDPSAKVYQLGAWFQMASSVAMIVKDGLRAKRDAAIELARRAIDTAIELNQIIAEAREVAEFWPGALGIGALLAGAIDDRGSMIVLAPHGATEAPLLDAKELKEGLALLHAGDERYFPTFPEVINQFASRLEVAISSGEIELTGYPSIDAGLRSRKSNERVAYVLTFCNEWDDAGRCGTVPKDRPSLAVLAAQTTAALDLPDDPDNPFDGQTVAVLLRDDRNRRNT